MKIKSINKTGIFTDSFVSSINIAENPDGSLDVRELDSARNVWMHHPSVVAVEIDEKKITVADIMKLITYDIRIEKRNEKGQLMDFDIDDYKNAEVKRIKPTSDGGKYMIAIEI